jgi:hypothetical protein
MASNDEKSDDKKESNPTVEQADRRKAIKTGVIVGGSVVGAAMALPKKWTRPIVDAVIVPAHAQVSPGAPTPAPTSPPTPPTSPPPTPPTNAF